MANTLLVNTKFFYLIGIPNLSGLIFILLLHHSLQYGSGLCTDHDVTNTALVNILLDETTGPNCDEIRLGAIQERAAIEYAVHSVNAALKRDGFNMSKFFQLKPDSN